jgi:ankyrin repeat protein
MRSLSPDRSPSPSNLNTFITEKQFTDLESEERIRAIEDNKLEKFTKLFKEDFDINSKHQISTKHSATYLHHAAFFGSHSIVEDLISKKADLETKRSDGDTALAVASRNSFRSSFFGKSLEDYEKTISLYELLFHT